MKQCPVTVLIASVVSVLSTAPLSAGTVTVTNTNDALGGSLRQAILDANPEDSIAFKIPTSDPGYDALTKVYTIDLTSAGLTISKNLGISGAGSRVVVRRNASSSFSVFTINPGALVSIDNLTISNGLASPGGGIFNEGDLTLSNCTLSGNQTGTAGGGIYNDNKATIRNCTFAANEAAQFSGAILNNVGTLILSDSTLSGNVGNLSGSAIEISRLGLLMSAIRS
jgi:hypothetical protein